MFGKNCGEIFNLRMDLAVLYEKWFRVAPSRKTFRDEEIVVSRFEVPMPQMGESIAEGTVSKWLISVGRSVQKDEPILEISTDKVDAEIPSCLLYTSPSPRDRG